MNSYPTYLIHYGIQGQKWGVRRFQNEDGSYTSDGLERRRKLIEEGASKKEIRKVSKEGKRELRYNKQLVKEQEKVGKKFDKKTEKILKDQEKGKNISQRRINKVIDLGSQYRMADRVAKNPEMYYKIKEADEKARNSSAASLLAFPIGMATIGMGVIDLSSVNVKKAMQQSYAYAAEEVKNETIEDLINHGIIKRRA